MSSLMHIKGTPVIIFFEKSAKVVRIFCFIKIKISTHVSSMTLY